MTKRSLTNGEVEFAYSTYRDSIDYTKVRVHDRSLPFLKSLGDMSFGGNLYLPDRYCDDFSLAPLPGKRLFRHELFHVWQEQNDVVNLLLAAGLELVKHQFNYDQAYLYHLEPDKDLLDYPFEAQAAIMDEYFLRKHGTTWAALPEAKGMRRCLNTGDDTQELLEDALENFHKDPSYPKERKNLYAPIKQSRVALPS